MMKEALELLKKAKSFALLGASAEPGKYGHKVFQTLKEHYRVFPVNPKRADIEGTPCFPSYAQVPEKPDAVILALAPQVTESVVPTLVAQGAPLIWLPPECFTDAAVKACRDAGVPVIFDICPVAAFATLQRQTAAFGAQRVRT